MSHRLAEVGGEIRLLDAATVSQLRCADVVLLNKIDLADERMIQNVRLLSD